MESHQPYLGNYGKICSQQRLYELSINRTEKETQTENITVFLIDFCASTIQATLVPSPMGTDTSNLVFYFVIWNKKLRLIFLNIQEEFSFILKGIL